MGADPFSPPKKVDLVTHDEVQSAEMPQSEGHSQTVDRTQSPQQTGAVVQNDDLDDVDK